MLTANHATRHEVTVRAHIVLAHPERESFNGLLATTTDDTLTRSGWEVTMSDLYRAHFDPRESADHYTERVDTSRFHAQTEQRFNAGNGTTPADVQGEIDAVMASDLLVVHFPLWWFGPPAILKGWMDRVFVYGAMYRSTERYDTGVCAGKQMIACVTTGASADSCSHDGREGDTRMHLWPVLFAFRYLGFEVLTPEILHGIGGVAFVEGAEDGTSAVDRYVQRWSSSLEGLHDRGRVRYNADAHFDDRKRLVSDAPTYSPFISHDPLDLW